MLYLVVYVSFFIHHLLFIIMYWCMQLGVLRSLWEKKYLKCSTYPNGFLNVRGSHYPIDFIVSAFYHVWETSQCLKVFILLFLRGLQYLRGLQSFRGLLTVKDFQRGSISERNFSSSRFSTSNMFSISKSLLVIRFPYMKCLPWIIKF